MAQQTINVGAAPNDGTGTPLRTAFQYTNSNFSELYTAVGPSGNNITVPGTATITGDLTVDTSTLKVDSANNRVGIGTATPGAGYSLDILGASVGGIRVSSNNYPNLVVDSANSNGALIYIQEGGTTQARIGHLTAVTGLEFSGNNGTAATNVHYAIDSTGISTWKNVGGVAGTAMTLNSTGLGVGGSPNYKLNLSGAGSSFASSPSLALYDTTVGSPNSRNWLIGNVAANNYGELVFCVSSAAGGAPTNVQMTLNSSGNLGIGVTPSAWSGGRAIDLQLYGNLNTWDDGTAAQIQAGFNFYQTGSTFKYKISSLASMYRQRLGVHSWHTAPSGTADTAITFTQAMTLDASGNLLVGKTARNLINAGVEILPSGQTTNIVASSVGGFTTLEVYSTTAAAYRFYVGLNGTISATNTTISAISDARLKENVQDIDVGLGAILSLKPRKFDWKAGKGKDIKGDRGFIAQEFEQVFPQLVDEWKDQAPEGEAPYKSVRQDLIPVLVKAIQELAAEVNALKNA